MNYFIEKSYRLHPAHLKDNHSSRHRVKHRLAKRHQVSASMLATYRLPQLTVHRVNIQQKCFLNYYRNSISYHNPIFERITTYT